ncbi:MAG: hypothetical protein ACK56F_05670 [bacterium]
MCYAQLIDPVAGSRLALAATFSTQHVFPQVHATLVIVVYVLLPGGVLRPAYWPNSG